MDQVSCDAAGGASPQCPDCHGILKPDAVFFGEMLPEKALSEATRRSRDCDVFMVVGSTLVVYPAALMPQYALESGARLMVVNLSTTPLDRQASVVIRSKAGEAMPSIVNRVKSKLGKGGAS